MSNLSNYSLSDLVKGIKKKDFSSEDITKIFIKNSENSTKLNTYITNRVKKLDKNAAAYILQGAIDYLSN